MLSRRELLTAAAGVATCMLGARGRASAADASQPGTRVNFDIPPGACDCHTHVFGDLRRFPFADARVYTPEPASVDEMRRLHRALHMDRVVIVQPSVYGTDNSCTVDAIAQLGSRARGVAVIGEQTPAATLDALHRAGVRGIRLNLETAGVSDPSEARRRFRAALDQLRGRPWHVQLNTRLSVIDALRDDLAPAAVPIVVDHFGGARAALGTMQPGFPALIELVRMGRAYVKISGAYRSSTQARS